ncbi:MAG: hypothetical protein ACC630_08185 [Nitrospinota bacterium]
MVEFPLDFIARTLSGFCVCYFKNATHDADAPPHFHITIPINDDASLLLCIITSQAESRIKYYKKTSEAAISSLLEVNNNDLSFLKKGSIVECNQPVLIHKQKFGKIVDPDHKFKVVSRDIPADIKEKIVKAIKDSPIVKPFIKKLIKYP